MRAVVIHRKKTLALTFGRLPNAAVASESECTHPRLVFLALVVSTKHYCDCLLPAKRNFVGLRVLRTE